MSSVDDRERRAPQGSDRISELEFSLGCTTSLVAGPSLSPCRIKIRGLEQSAAEGLMAGLIPDSKLGDSTRGILDGWDLGEDEDCSELNEVSGRHEERAEPRASGPEPAQGAAPPREEIGGPARSVGGLCSAFNLDTPSEDADAFTKQRFPAPEGQGPQNAPTNRRRANLAPLPDPSKRRQLPKAGETIGGYRLVKELGRGAFARVFLAEELSLGNRLVALKVSPAEGDEPRILARFQHPHIVPVYSVHDDPTTGLRLLCMPFLGGTNLARLLEEAWGQANSHATGKTLVEMLDHLSQRLPSALREEVSFGFNASGTFRSRHRLGASTGPGSTLVDVAGRLQGPIPRRSEKILAFVRRLTGRDPNRSELTGQLTEDVDIGLPARRFLLGADGIRASAWIIARLAEGLDHAHVRGLLHRDLKPSNILIAADGSPMLLDFNLAAESALSIEEGQPIPRAILGGTLPYMSPEHLDAFDAQGGTRPEDVDERSDLYAMGLILFQMIAGDPPFAPRNVPATVEVIREMRDERRRLPVPSLRKRVPNLPWSLDAIVSKCLHPDPRRRYCRARDLAEDLSRFLDDEPLKHCPEPSLRERVAKWRRRHPALCSSSSVAFFAGLLIVSLNLLFAYAYESNQGLAARVRLKVFEEQVMNSQFLLSTTRKGEASLERGLHEARQALDSLVIKRRQFPTPGRAQMQETAVGRTVELGAGWCRRLAPDELEMVRKEAVGLILLATRAEVELSRHGSEGDRRQALVHALGQLDLAEQLSGGESPALLFDRGRYHAAMGDAEAATRDWEESERGVSASGYDWTMLGMSRLAAGKRDAAEAALQEAIRLDATSFWAWFGLGHCHFEQGRFLESAGDFAACIARGPKFAWPYFNRGLALARGARPREAVIAFDQALRLEPDLTEARVNRAFALLELNRLDEARNDLEQAVEQGCHEVAALAALGETLSRLGRRGEAEDFFERLLRRDPDHSVVLVARGFSRLRHNPEAARLDFELVLEQDRLHPMAHFGLARVLKERDHRQALAHLQVALEVNSDFLDAIELRALERARIGDRSAVDDVDRLVRAPTPNRLYNAACALAILGELLHENAHQARAVELLESALINGFPASDADRDPDLRPLASRPDYRRLMGRHLKAR